MRKRFLSTSGGRFYLWCSLLLLTAVRPVAGSEFWLGEELLIRPINRPLQDHFWTTIFGCRPVAVARADGIHELEPYFKTKEHTTLDRSYAVDLTWNQPIGPCACLSARGAVGWDSQENRVTKATNFAVALQRGGLGGQIRVGCLRFFADLFVKGASQFKTAVFPFESTVRFEPSLVAAYVSSRRCLLGGFYLDSIIVRDPFAVTSYLTTREHLILKYEYRISPPHRALGAQGHITWYNDGPKNCSQGTSVWFRTGFPGLERCVFFRYQFDYSRFNKVVAQYLSYNHRVVHAGVFTWIWRFSRPARLMLEVIYGWMRTRELNDPGEQTTPTGAIVPVIIFKQTANLARFRGALRYRLGCLDLGLVGTFYWDSIHYEAFRLTGCASYIF